jgi:hypothetical protein
MACAGFVQSGVLGLNVHTDMSSRLGSAVPVITIFAVLVNLLWMMFFIYRRADHTYLSVMDTSESVTLEYSVVRIYSFAAS